MNEIFAEDKAIGFDDFGEDVIYKPYLGDPIEIVAIISRNHGEKVPGAPVGNVSDITVMIQNDAEAGVTTIVKGKDKISLPVKWGETPQDKSVVEIISGEGGVWNLQVR